jgi:WD40 repeat protein
MKPVAAKRIFTLLVPALLVSAGIASAQPDKLPPRSFQRFGTTKLRHGSRILSLAYSPDGQILAAGGGNDPLRLWNPKTGAMIREINEPWVHALTFTATGKTLLFGGYQKHIRLWNFELDKETGRLDGHKAAVKAIAVSPDTAVIASGSQDGALYLWDMESKCKVAELVGHTDEVNALAFSPDTDINLLASAGSDRLIFIWDTETNKFKHKLDGGCGVCALAFSADGKTLYSAGDDSLIRRWDVASGKQTGTFKGHEGTIVSLFVQGETVVSGALDKTIRFWDAPTFEQRRSLPRRQGDCDALAVTKAGDFLATAGTNNTLRIFEAANGKEVVPAPGIQSGLVGLVLSPNNKRLACTTADGQILVWDPQTGKLLRQWHAKQTGDILLAFASDGKTLASASNIVRLWNADTGDEISQLPTRNGDPVMTLAFSPDDKTLALGAHSGHIDLVDVKAKKSVASFNYTGALQAIAWSPDGRKLAAAGGAKIFVWDPLANRLIRSFDVKEGPPPPFPMLVASLAFAPDSKTLAAGGWDAVIRIYNLNAKNPTDGKQQRLCEGHASAVYAIAFSPDGHSLISGSFDKTARLWEAFSGKQIAAFKGHRGEVRGVAFGNDGRSVFSAGADTVVYHWDVPGLLNNGKLPERPLTFQELENAWTALLAEETARGHETMWRCIASAKQAIPQLSKKLEPFLIAPEKVKKLFRDLDSGHYPTRMAAMNKLPEYGRWMEGRYEAAMAYPPSLEYKRRAELLKEKLNVGNSPSLAQERLRVRRIMLMCEQVGGPDAIEALRKLADNGPEEELREEAQAALQRLSKR